MHVLPATQFPVPSPHSPHFGIVPAMLDADGATADVEADVVTGLEHFLFVEVDATVTTTRVDEDFREVEVAFMTTKVEDCTEVTELTFDVDVDFKEVGMGFAEEDGMEVETTATAVGLVDAFVVATGDEVVVLRTTTAATLKLLTPDEAGAHIAAGV